MMDIIKNIKISWLKDNLKFERGVFLEGDLNVANLDIHIEEFIEGSHLELTFYNENEKKLYALEQHNLQKNTMVKIPNKVLQISGTVFVRIAQVKKSQILQATEEVYFYVVKKKTMNL